MTTTSFADYAAEQQEREELADTILLYSHALCEALKHNYINHCIASHQNEIGGIDESSDSWHKSEIERISGGDCDYEYIIESGNKYYKVIMVARGAKSAHCFIDKKTGDVYKSATWKSPAKKIRYNLMDDTQREWLLENADWSGGYLYQR